MIQDQSQSSFGLSPNVAAGLAALFGWVGGLVILLGKPPQQWVRFVAVQAIVLGVAFFVFLMALNILSGMLAAVHLGILTLIVIPIDGVLSLAFFVAWIITTISAFQGKAVRLPIVAEWADRWVPASAQL